MEHNVDKKSLYVVSPRPGAKFARLREQLGVPSGSILTPKKVNPAAYGKSVIASGDKIYEAGREMSGRMATMALKSTASMRMTEEMFTVVLDPECVSDLQRKEYVEEGQRNGYDVKFLVMDATPEQAQHYARTMNLLLSKAMDRFHRFNPESQYETVNYTPELTFNYDYNRIDSDKLDVIGDIHGMYGELKDLVKDMGYEIHNDTAIHPEGRKIMFMGDYVDRGYDSLNVLRLVKNTVEAGNGYAILGNHEDMLLEAFESAEKYGQIKASSLSSGETIDALLRTNKKERDEIVDFLKTRPGFYTYEEGNRKYVFAHADIESFDPLTTPKTHLMHGDGEHVKKDSDLGYQKLFDKGYNKYTLIRGHCLNTSKQRNVISLEGGQAFGGHLVGLQFDKMRTLEKMKAYNPYDAAEKTKMYVECSNTHNYKFRKDAENKLYAIMENAVSIELAEKIQDAEMGLNLYRGTEKAYREDRFFIDYGAQKSTGLVLDQGGRVIIHPPDRVGDAGDEILYPEPNEEVMAIDDVRGYTVNVSKNPYGTGLLVTTSSSLKSRYTEMAEDMLHQQGVYDKLNSFLSNKEMTLSFAVRHPEDKRNRISEDADEEYGVTLISSRKNTPNGATLSESGLDKVAKVIGAERPNWEKRTFKSVVNDMVISYYSNTQNNIKNPNLVLRKIDENGKENPLRFRMPSPKNLENKLSKMMTAGGIEKLKEDITPIASEHYVMRLGFSMLMSSFMTKEEYEKHSQKERESIKLERATKAFDLAGIRTDKTLSKEERKEKLEKAKEEKERLIHQSIKMAYRQVLREKGDPYKQKKLEDIQHKADMEREKKEKIQEMRKQKTKSTSPSPS